MCSMIDSGEKGYKLPEQILFNSLVLYLTLYGRFLRIFKIVAFFQFFSRFLKFNSSSR